MSLFRKFRWSRVKSEEETTEFFPLFFFSLSRSPLRPRTSPRRLKPLRSSDGAQPYGGSTLQLFSFPGPVREEKLVSLKRFSCRHTQHLSPKRRREKNLEKSFI